MVILGDVNNSGDDGGSGGDGSGGGLSQVDSAEFEIYFIHHKSLAVHLDGDIIDDKLIKESMNV